MRLHLIKWLTLGLTIWLSSCNAPLVVNLNHVDLIVHDFDVFLTLNVDKVHGLS